MRIPVVLAFVLAAAAAPTPGFAQMELTGNYTGRLYEDYIERGPGSDLGDFTGVPLNDDARARALLYVPTMMSMVEHQCLAYSPWSGQYRPQGVRIVSDVDEAGNVLSWTIRGDFSGSPKVTVTPKSSGDLQVMVRASNSTREFLISNGGLGPIGDSPEAFGRFIHDEIAKWSKIAKDVGARAD